ASRSHAPQSVSRCNEFLRRLLPMTIRRERTRAGKVRTLVPARPAAREFDGDCAQSPGYVTPEPRFQLNARLRLPGRLSPKHRFLGLVNAMRVRAGKAVRMPRANGVPVARGG